MRYDMHPAYLVSGRMTLTLPALSARDRNLFEYKQCDELNIDSNWKRNELARCGLFSLAELLYLARVHSRLNRPPRIVQTSQSPQLRCDPLAWNLGWSCGTCIGPALLSLWYLSSDHHQATMGQSPNIVRLFEIVFEAENCYQLIMQYGEGLDVAKDWFLPWSAIQI